MTTGKESLFTDALQAIDRDASIAHDFIYGRNDVTQEQASAAIWRIHDAVNTFADAADVCAPQGKMGCGNCNWHDEHTWVATASHPWATPGSSYDCGGNHPKGQVGDPFS